MRWRGEIYMEFVWGRNGPALSHLMFADDSMLFCRAAPQECAKLKEILSGYELASGQAVNLSKSGIFFSQNVSEVNMTAVSNMLGVHQRLNTGRYLGLPSLIGRNKKAIFSFLRDRMWRRIQGWQGKKLSKAGKEVLIKSVAQAIPAYCMTSFLLPSCLTDELEKMMNSFWWGNNPDMRKGIEWMRWERLCTRKDLGGLGFRNLQLFNIAMLRKIGWRLITDPDALVCRVLKAKYYPGGSFLNAKIGHCPSFTWRSICSSQDLLRSGMRWRIGNREKVRVYSNPWLRKDGDFYIASAQDPNMEDIRVKDLIIPGNRSWDSELIEELFDEAEAKHILSIPLSPNGGEDNIIWHYSRKGIYTVSSAYDYACSLTIDRDLAIYKDWKKLWRLKIPPKVKNFLWRAAHNCLSTKEKLLHKGIPAGGNCGLCSDSYETSWHIFVDCPFAKGCWDAAELSEIMRGGVEVYDSLSDLIFHIINQNKSEISARWSLLLYHVWRSRNDMIWNSKDPSPFSTTRMAHGMMKEWLIFQIGAKRCSQGSKDNSVCRGWHDLPSGWFCCFVDAAFFASANRTGIG